MNELKAPSLQSLLESDRGSTDSLLAESLQLDIEDLDDVEYSIPPLGVLPTLESVLSEFEGDSDIASTNTVPAPTPTPSMGGDENTRAGGSILRHVLLQGVSSQTSSAADRVHAGMATACAVSQLIAVGTSHGHILNFDNTQTLRWAHQDKSAQGAVTALDYNQDCSRLLAGYARGLVVMIDTHSGDVLRNLFDSITPNTGVLHVKWTSRPALALCSDSGGSVWSLSFTRKLGIRGCASRCLFSGARGEVCAFEPLITDTDVQHDLDQYSIVALATLSKYFIVTIRPRLRVIKFHTLTGPPDCLPLLAWQMVLIQAADSSRTIDPVIVVGRGNQLFFHQLFINSGRINLLFLRHVQLACNLLAVHWLGTKSVACLDTSEILHLIDVRSSKESECLDIATAGLVYGSAQFKGLATGGNVSPALALAGSYACYNTVVSRGTQLYVLGARSMHMITVRTWSERISYLVKNQRWTEACDLAIECYKAAGDRPRKKIQAKERAIVLFREYIAGSSRAPEYCLGSIVNCLIEVNELDLLWDELWDRLHSTGLFLTLITEHIEKDSIKRVNPIISQALVDFWLNLSPQKLEEILLKLDWTCLDLDQVLKAVKKKKLFRAQMYLNTKALGDYTISLIELIPQIHKEEPHLGNSLLVYISSCLAGRGYPHGDIPVEQVQHVKHEVLRCLASLHSSTSEPNELPYPYLRALLKFDTRETLNVISLAFQEKEFNGELGFSHRKRIINILLEIMTPENATWSEIGCLLNFISQQISSNCLPADSTLIDKVINYLAMEEITGETARQHSERESAWHELLSSNFLQHLTDEEQLRMARKANCYQVVEYLLEKLQIYDEILECYLNNQIRYDSMFAYIEMHAKNPERKVYEQLLLHFPRILSIDAEKTTRIVAVYFSNNIVDLISTTKSDTKLLFAFLKALHRLSVPLNSVNSETLLELLCINEPQSVDQFLENCDAYRIETALDIVQKHHLTTACIMLFEKQGDYQMAFDLSLKLLKEASEENAEACALQISSLCARASQVLSVQEREEYWFELLNLILSREYLKSITKNMLHEASQHVDLPRLVQLVMNTGTVSGNIGDIKDLLMGMLSNSRYETHAMATTAKILGADLHEKFVKRQKEAHRGLWVTFVKCVICRQRLYNQTDVLVLGPCGHSMHVRCIEHKENGFNDCASHHSHQSEDEEETKFKCPRCGSEIPESEPLELSQPTVKLIECNRSKENVELGVLQLKAPPRKF